MSATLPASEADGSISQGCLRQCFMRLRLVDSRLTRVVQIVLAGLAVLAWLVQPRADDSALAISMLMFLRFVPVFILVGSRWGRAGAGAVVGMGVFFALMGAESLSVLAWDAEIVAASTRAAQRVATLANLLYFLGLVSVLLCVAVIFFLNRGTSQSSDHYARTSLRIMAAVQTILVAELAYLGYRNSWSDESPRIQVTAADHAGPGTPARGR